MFRPLGSAQSAHAKGLIVWVTPTQARWNLRSKRPRSRADRLFKAGFHIPRLMQRNIQTGFGAFGSFALIVLIVIASGIILCLSVRSSAGIRYTMAVIQDWLDYIISRALYIGLGSFCYSVAAFASPLVAPLTATFLAGCGAQAAPAVVATATSAVPATFIDPSLITAGHFAVASLLSCLAGAELGVHTYL